MGTTGPSLPSEDLGAERARPRGTVAAVAPSRLHAALRTLLPVSAKTGGRGPAGPRPPHSPPRCPTGNSWSHGPAGPPRSRCSWRPGLRPALPPPCGSSGRQEPHPRGDPESSRRVQAPWLLSQEPQDPRPASPPPRPSSGTAVRLGSGEDVVPTSGQWPPPQSGQEDGWQRVTASLAENVSTVSRSGVRRDPAATCQGSVITKLTGFALSSTHSARAREV